MWVVCKILFAVLQMQAVIAAKNTINIGGLFHPHDQAQRIVFARAISHLNNDQPFQVNMFQAHWDFTNSEDSFQVSRQTCRFLNLGVTAIFGPQSSEIARHVQSICDTFDIPHIETRWDPYHKPGALSVNLYPSHEVLGKAYSDLIQIWGWKSFAIVYENSDDLLRVEEVLKMHRPANVNIKVVQLPQGNDYRKVLETLKRESIVHIVVDIVSLRKTVDFLRQAREVDMMTAKYNYFSTSLDFHIVDLSEFQTSNAKIRSLSLVDRENPELNQTLTGFMTVSSPQIDPKDFFKTETVLMYDAVLLYAQAFQELFGTQDFRIHELSCNGNKTWEQGYSLLNFLRTSTIEGLTGTVTFDYTGRRSNFTLNVMELGRDGFLKRLSVWTPATYNTNFKGLISEALVSRKQKKEYAVTTLLNTPYVMLKENAETLVGNDRYEGFCIDLLDEVANLMEISYTIEIAPDGRYGSLDEETGNWDGLMGRVIDGDVDLAIGDITITPERDEVVDFTVPFMTTGISILYHKNPLALEIALVDMKNSAIVWGAVLVAYIVVSVLFYLFSKIHISKLTPPEKDIMRKECSIGNCFWYAISVFMHQGNGALPKSPSIRVVSAVWWLFGILLLCSYSASIVVGFMESNAINSKEKLDLWEQTTITYGCIKGGSTEAFFRDSKIYEYQKMFIAMDENPSVYVTSNEEGIERVIEESGRYAFLMESTSLEYIVNRNCDLAKIGTAFDSKGYGIAMAKGSIYRSSISSAILTLQESGTISQLKSKWWISEEENCEEMDEIHSGYFDGLFQVAGLLEFLLLGLIIATAVAACEKCCKASDLSLKSDVAE